MRRLAPGETRGGSVVPGDEKIQYTGGTEVKRLKIINTAELEIEAEKILPKGGYGYIFGGSGAEYTKRENLRAMEAIGLEPHFLSGVLKPDLSVTILGLKGYPSRSSSRRWAAMDWRMSPRRSAPRRPLPRPAR